MTYRVTKEMGSSAIFCAAARPHIYEMGLVGDSFGDTPNVLIMHFFEVLFTR